MSDSTNLYNPNDNVTGRDGGPYLDEVEAREAEKRRAVIEDREPDLDNPPPTAGIPLNTGARQVAVMGVNNLPSQTNRVGVGVAESVERASIDAAEETGLRARAEIPAEFNDLDVEAKSEESDEVEANPMDVTGSGSNESEDEDFFDLDNDPADPEHINFDPEAGAEENRN